MNQPGSDNQKPQGLDEFLDRRMDEPARLRFQQRLEQDAELRAEVERQRAIDESLRRRFVPPPVAQAAARLRTAKTRQRPSSRFQQLMKMQVRFRYVAAAAIILLVIGLAIWQLWPAPRAAKTFPRRSYVLPAMTVAQFYQANLDSGFKPKWECPPDEFQQVCLAQFDQALTYEISADSGVTMAGVSYSNTISANTLVMLAHVQGRPVMVFIDRADQNPGQNLLVEPGQKLKLFQAQIGGLALYELSPLNKPYVLALFRQPADVDPCRPR